MGRKRHPHVCRRQEFNAKRQIGLIQIKGAAAAPAVICGRSTRDIPEGLQNGCEDR